LACRTATASTAAFLPMAIGAGMTSAIMNPVRQQEMEAIRAANFLMNHDPNGGEWIRFAKVLEAVEGGIVARPGFGAPDPGVLAAAASAVCFATTAILTKVLTRGESIVSILFWLTVMQLGLGLATAGWDGDLALPTAQTLPWLALIGACGLLAHFCLTKALSLAPASVVVPIDFARLPVIAAVGWYLYGEALEWPVVLGATLIFLGIWINLRGSHRASPQQPDYHKAVTPRR
jgi:drug/metabolite transporter (DMT)-like permease